MHSCIDHCNLRLFADDSLIYHEISCQASIVELQSDLDRLAVCKSQFSFLMYSYRTLANEAALAKTYCDDGNTVKIL